jgi:uncharacterized protein (TIGR02145 family)
MCKKTILNTASISILAVLFYTVCDDNGVKVVTPEVTTFEDIRDGKIYKKVQIGSQIWMAENLRYAADGSRCYDNGSGLMAIRQPDGTVKGYSVEEYCEYIGRLYDWYTAMDDEESSGANPSGVEGVCPVGWHIPSDAEWETLIDYVGINAGSKLKSRTFEGETPGTVTTPTGTDKYRFSALKGPSASDWWSSTERESNEEMAWTRNISPARTTVYKGPREKHQFLSVRCVHD